MNPAWIALAASALFAGSEAVQHWLTRTAKFSAFTIAIERFVLGVPVAYFACLFARKPVTFSLNVIHRIYWIRAFLTSATIYLLLYAFSKSKAQGLAYILFLLHPIWMFAMESLWERKLALTRRGYVPAIGSLLSIGCYTYLISDSSGFSLLGAVASLFAGVTFAASNFLSPLLKAKLNHSDAEKQFYTSYFCVAFGALALLVDWISPRGLIKTHLAEMLTSVMVWDVLRALIATTVIGYFANLLLTIAYGKGKGNNALIAAIDVTVVPFALVIDLSRGAIQIHDLLNYNGAAIAATLIFVGWLTLWGK